MSRDKGKHIHTQLPCHKAIKKVGWILTGTSMGLVIQSVESSVEVAAH